MGGRSPGRTLLAALTVLVCAAAGSVPGAATAAEPGVCAWPVKSDPNLVNIAFPDESATYWGTVGFGIPPLGLTVRGRFPHARYFSFHAYDVRLKPVAGIADRDIVPDGGAPNPFHPGVPEPAPGAEPTYTLRILPGKRPADPPPNTIYVGESSDGLLNPVAPVLYRTYTADDPGDVTGGVGPPQMALELGALSVPLGGCSLPPLPDLGINDLIAKSSWPEGLPGIPIPIVDEPDPEWNRFVNLETLLFGSLPEGALKQTLIGGKGGFLSNTHVEYVTAAISREFGDVFVARIKMPTSPDTRAGEPPWEEGRQLRYWSICQNEFALQRYVDCIPDQDAVLDDDGYLTLVISDPADRPANADAEHGVNWLPWGGIYPDGRVIYRQMLPAPGFAEAVANIGPGQTARDVMGPYYPQSAYCAQATFEAGGISACLAP